MRDPPSAGRARARERSDLERNRASATIRGMQTERIPVAGDVELAADIWLPAAPSGAPFLLVHGLASNARLWDGVAAGLVADGHPALTVDLRGHGRSSKPDGPYDVPTVADDLAALIARLGARPAGRGRPVVGRQRRPGARRPPPGARARGSSASTGAGSSRAASSPIGTPAGPRSRHPGSPGRPFAEIEGYIRSAHRDWPETGIRGTLANFEVRPDGTVAPWLTFDHHIAVLRGLWEHHPSERYPDLAVPVLLAPVDGGDTDWTRRKRRDVDARGGSDRRTPGSTGSSATTTSMPSTRTNWQA